MGQPVRRADLSASRYGIIPARGPGHQRWSRRPGDGDRRNVRRRTFGTHPGTSRRCEVSRVLGRLVFGRLRTDDRMRCLDRRRRAAQGVAARECTHELRRGHGGTRRAPDRTRAHVRLLLGSELWRRRAVRPGAELSRLRAVTVHAQRHPGAPGPRGLRARLAHRAPSLPARCGRGRGRIELHLVRVLPVELHAGVRIARGHDGARPGPLARGAPHRPEGPGRGCRPADRLGDTRRGRGARVLGLPRNCLFRGSGGRDGRVVPPAAIAPGTRAQGARSPSAPPS